MKALHLTWFHLRRILSKNWGFLIMSFAFPLILIFGFLFIMNSESSLMSEQSNSVINHSDYVSETIAPQLDETYQNYFVDDPAEAFHQLDQIEVSAVYEIPEGFPYSESSIIIHSINGENRDVLFEAAFISTLTDTMLNSAYEEADISFETIEVAEPEVESTFVSVDSDMAFVLFMLLFFMGYSTGSIASDLAKMRKEGLLTRSLISNTYSWQILGSVLGAYLIYSFISNILIVLLASGLFSIPLSNLVLGIGLILSMGIFVTGLTMLLFRIFRNETLIQMVGLILIMILVFVPLFTQSMDNFSNLQYISPYYWVFESLDTGQLFPHVYIISLYGIVMFTAGSFKVERLVQI